MTSEESDNSIVNSESEVESEQDDGEDKTTGFLNKEGLLQALEVIQNSNKWIEKLSVTTNLAGTELPTVPDDTQKAITGSVHDDFQRELGFYCQAQAAAKEALARLRELGVATQRPEDYFAEMAKTDTHMQKVRSRLQSIKLVKEAAEKKRKMRQMKKFGKKVQQEVLEKRREEKKQILNEVNRIKKGKGKFNDKPGEDLFDVSTKSFTKGKDRNLNTKRKKKNEKYGFGGKKRMQRKNTTESSWDPKAFNPAKHGKGTKASKHGKGFKSSKQGKKKPLKRLGKARRAKQKMKKR